MATSVLQPESQREHEPKAEIADSPRLTDDERMYILEAKERETGELPPELRERARLELREEPAIREHALAQMRHFIEKHPAIKKSRTGKLINVEYVGNFKTPGFRTQMECLCIRNSSSLNLSFKKNCLINSNTYMRCKN